MRTLRTDSAPVQVRRAKLRPPVSLSPSERLTLSGSHGNTVCQLPGFRRTGQLDRHCYSGSDEPSEYDSFMKWPLSHRIGSIAPGRVGSIVEDNVALAGGLNDDQRDRLLELTAAIVNSKRWEATGSMELTDEILVTVSANAAIPILELDLWVYRHVHWIVIHPSTTVSTAIRSGPTRGVVSDGQASIIGQAAPNTGPISISWDSALSESRSTNAGRNVVIHEFAHKIDMSDGYSDGLPPVTGARLTNWMNILDMEFTGDGSSSSDAVLRPYAWASPAEFFAVSTEAFFCSPVDLQRKKPELYSALSDFYRQDPAARSIDNMTGDDERRA